MYKKIAIITVILFALLISAPVSAAVDNTSKVPALNPFCWHRSDCEKINKNGFVSDLSTAPCTGGTGAEEWGRCLPAGETKTEISFGGQDKFANVGDFIIVMYKYLLTIASIVAVVVIIIAGAQWTTSGGNSEAISSAKKRIGGAIIGLFIAYMSYFVLNTINPALVNLRLPQVWLIKSQALVPEFCADIPDATTTLKFALVADSSEPDKPVPPPDKRNNYALYNTQGCGNRYLAENGGETTCVGNGCNDQLSCINKTGDGKTYECTDARMYGRITYSSFFKACGFIEGAVSVATDKVTPWDCPPVQEGEWLVGICTESGEGIKVGEGHGQTKNHYWIDFPASGPSGVDGVVANCQQYHGDIKGFAADFEMEASWEFNRRRLIGKGGVDLGETKALLGNINKIDPKYLFTVDEVKKGVRLDIDAGDISDNKDLSVQNKSYWEPAYQNQ